MAAHTLEKTCKPGEIKSLMPAKNTERKTMTEQNIIDVAEQKRLNDAREAAIPWKKWGPYLSERQWGTVLER